MIYLHTLDSHDCFGRFPDHATAHHWAKRTGKSTYELLTKPPHPDSVVLNPHDPEMIAAFNSKALAEKA